MMLQSRGEASHFTEISTHRESLRFEECDAIRQMEEVKVTGVYRMRTGWLKIDLESKPGHIQSLESALSQSLSQGHWEALGFHAEKLYDQMCFI